MSPKWIQNWSQKWYAKGALKSLRFWSGPGVAGGDRGGSETIANERAGVGPGEGVAVEGFGEGRWNQVGGDMTMKR